MAHLRVEKLQFYYGITQILKDIDLELEKGEITTIVGPSGGGKTTLLHLCAGLLDVTEGKISQDFKSTAFVFQDARLLPWKTMLENIMLPLGDYGANAQKEAIKLALRFGLEEEDFMKYPKDLSGGMRQRVSFARALIAKPELLFLDEPFSALDIGLKEDLQQYVLEANAEEGMSVLCITHDMMEAVKLSDTIMLLKSDPGEIIKIYSYDTPKLKRDYAYVFKETHALLQQDIIREIFEIKGNS
ncbi:MAG: ATP-binding cassette domain-containing protein [Campylobacteraceae bacterium]|nr:ATP-binding cassette domain-containing protein [Campylobacteraceae bacterium]